MGAQMRVIARRALRRRRIGGLQRRAARLVFAMSALVGPHERIVELPGRLDV